MENFFNQIFSSYEEFNEKFIEWQDANFQLITINKCDKFKQGTDEFKTRFKYERVRFHFHHSGNQKSGKILNATQVDELDEESFTSVISNIDEEP